MNPEIINILVMILGLVASIVTIITYFEQKTKAIEEAREIKFKSLLASINRKFDIFEAKLNNLDSKNTLEHRQMHSEMETISKKINTIEMYYAKRISNIQEELEDVSGINKNKR